jgi:hypothetical protein
MDLDGYLSLISRRGSGHDEDIATRSGKGLFPRGNKL